MAITDKTTLALTLRPKSFDDVIGLEKPLNIIKTKLNKGEVPRAILIRGQYGCGKTTLAHIIARYIQGPMFDGTPSVQEVNAAHYRKIENMRVLAESAGAYPMQGTYSVIILDECHKLTGDAQDILLKELEVAKSPTVWILCTTDPQDINKGVLDRCFPLDVHGMNEEEKKELVERAVAVTEFSDGEKVKEFLRLLNKYNVVSPRQVLGAFEQLNSGNSPMDSVAAFAISATPEYHDIAFAVVFGDWYKSMSLWGGKMNVRPVGELIRDLEDALGKKGKTEDNELVTVDDDEIVDSKPQAARTLRAVLGAFLKGRVLPKALKGGTYKFPSAQDGERADKAMHVLANLIPADAFELQWSGVVLTLYRINRIMQGR